MARAGDENVPESDAASDAPHPRMSVQLYGHAEAERELLEAYRSGKLHHAWIIGGEKGIGKATLAWRFAKFILSNPEISGRTVQSASSLAVAPDNPAVQRIQALGHGDIHVLRREWNEKTKKHYTEIRAEDVRAAVHLFQQAASEDGYRIVILDSAEDLNTSGANSLLKMIEEPPAKSLFLIVAHRPNQILPTIRSRCRKLLLRGLTIGECAAALKEFCGTVPDEQIESAARLAGGSVARALKLLDADSLSFYQQLQRSLSALPDLKWREIHALADTIAGRANNEAFETSLEIIHDWLESRIAPGNSGALWPWADVWALIESQIRETESYNLDRRPLFLNIFSELAKAARIA